MYLLDLILSLFFKTPRKHPSEVIKKPKICVEEATSIKLTRYITFITNSPINLNNFPSGSYLSNYSSEDRPLCILMCWLNAPPNALKRYLKFYNDLGYDILVVRTVVADTIFPTNGDRKLVEELIPVLLSSDHKIKIIHGLSVAAFVCARLTQHLEDIKAKDKAGIGNKVDNFLSSIKCQVWDSCVTAEGAKIGITTAFFPNSPMLQKISVFLMCLQHKLFYNWTERIFVEGDLRLRNVPIQIPALFFYSKADRISTFESMESLKNSWVEKGVECTSKVWPDSDHVMLMRDHREEYQTSLKKFLDNHIK